eukprot:1677077-Pleurochrysis_carterae.AAC.1
MPTCARGSIGLGRVTLRISSAMMPCWTRCSQNAHHPSWRFTPSPPLWNRLKRSRCHRPNCS